jgi:ABC-type sugar transport system ATPase subunit
VTISQELTLAPSLSVAENVFLGRLPRGRARTIDWTRCHRDAAALLDELDVHVDPRARVSELSIELQQEVEIARALSSRARLLVLDEATSSLSEAAVDRLLTIVEEQRQKGVAVLMISHRMPELYRSASVATVLRDGRLMGSVPLPETDEARLVRMMVGRDLDDYFGRRTATVGEVALEVRDLATADGRLKPTSFQLRGGQILGIAGLVGSGKTELGLALGGVLPCTGEVLVGGSRVSITSPRAALAGGIGFVPEDRKRQSILPERSVAENFTLSWMSDLSSWGVLRVGEEKRRVADSMTRYGVTAASEKVKISTLSGGNQQKVVLGKWLWRPRRLLIMDEPTRGIDVAAKAEIHRLLVDFAEQGIAVLLISSELPEVLGLAHRIGVMHAGRLVDILDRGEATPENVIRLAAGGAR